MRKRVMKGSNDRRGAAMSDRCGPQSVPASDPPELFHSLSGNGEGLVHALACSHAREDRGWARSSSRLRAGNQTIAFALHGERERMGRR